MDLLFDDFLHWLLRQNPIRGSKTGYHDVADALLPNRSVAAIQAVKNDCQGFADRSQRLLEGADELRGSKRYVHAIERKVTTAQINQ